MEGKEVKKKGLFSYLGESIQLRFYKSENFEQIGSMELSPRSIYIFVSSFILLVLILVFCLLAFTPLQRLIPRLSTIENSAKFIELNRSLDEIEASLVSQEIYLSAFRKMLVGNTEVNLSDLQDANVKEDHLESHSSSKGTRNPDKSILLPLKEDSGIRTEKASIFDELQQVDFFAPVEGLVSADFDPQKKHLGVDIIAPENTPVKAIKDGYIIIADWSIDTGHTIGIQHDHNILSFYKHNSVLLKEKGNFVKAGEIIAIIGNSGKLTSGPHLHFEMWHNGKPVNPNDYINLNK
jgi:murein DD-endopeptidase MepM/ murein hydrolase activator NlpD